MFFLLSMVLGAPHIQVVPQIFDAGQMYETDTVYAYFVIKNIGDKPLVIRRIRPTCLCTILNEKEIKDTLLPGDTDTLRVSVILFGFVGNIMKPVYIYSNDPENGLIKIFVKVFVLETIALPEPVYDPEKVELGKIFYGTTKEFTVWVKNEGEADLIVAQIDLPEGIKLKTKLPVIVKRMRQMPVVFEFNSAVAGEGEYNRYLTFRTNYRRNYRFDLPVHGVVEKGGLNIFSPVFLFDNGAFWLFLIKNTGNRPFEFEISSKKNIVKPGEVKSVRIEKERLKGKKIRVTIEIPVEEIKSTE